MRDVAGACEYLRKNTGPFLPSISVLREQAKTESEVRMTYEAIPYFGDPLLPGQTHEDRMLDAQRASDRINSGRPPWVSEDEQWTEWMKRRMLGEGDDG